MLMIFRKVFLNCKKMAGLCKAATYRIREYRSVNMDVGELFDGESRRRRNFLWRSF